VHVRHAGKAISLVVMAGLDPAIHHSSKDSCEDGWMRGSSPHMTLRGPRKLTIVAKALWMILFCSNR
jgi:hypothetical protein